MRVWHYLYFPSEQVAKQVAAALETQGYGVECRESPPNWLVGARHMLAADQGKLESAAAELGRLATVEGGEYDGWEREISRVDEPLS